VCVGERVVRYFVGISHTLFDFETVKLSGGLHVQRSIRERSQGVCMLPAAFAIHPDTVYLLRAL